MTPQEIFDKVWDHLNRQGVQSAKANGTCLYRGPNGTMCAVGCLIDDETAEKWEGRAVSEVDFPLPPDLADHQGLLDSLQCAHDFANDDMKRPSWVEGWRDRMRVIAEQRSLTVPPIPEPTP